MKIIDGKGSVAQQVTYDNDHGTALVETFENNELVSRLEFNAEGQLVNNFVVEDEPIAFVDGVAVYDEDTLNRLTNSGETDTSIEGLIADLELMPSQAASLITALETAAIDNVYDVDFYQLEDGRVIITNDEGQVLSTFTPNDDAARSKILHNFNAIFMVNILQANTTHANEDEELRRVG